jgi:hypothetical protein
MAPGEMSIMSQGKDNGIAPNWSRLTRPQGTILIVLLVSALALRWFHLGVFPRPNQTADEYHYLWAGLNLLHEGKATSWSNPEYYRGMPIPQKTIVFRQAPYCMVTPALDHPPLFSLGAGSFARATGAHRIPVPQPDGTSYVLWDVDLGRARLLSLILFCATFLLLFEVCRHAFSFDVAAITLCFYGAIAHIVVHNRLLVTENLTTPLFLLNIYYLQRYVAGKSSETAFAAVSILATAAALLSKVVAVSQAPAIIVLLLLCGRRREIVYPALGVLLGGALYALYGWWQGWDTFLALLATQAARFSGFGELKRFIVVSAIVHDPDVSVPLFAAWILLFAEILHRRESLLLAAAPLYLLSFSYFACVADIYGWHSGPFYPFLCMALAIAIHRIWKDAHMPGFLVLLSFFYLYVFSLVFGAYPDYRKILRLAYLLLTPLLILLPLLQPKTRKHTIRLTTIALVAIALIRELWVNWSLK